MKWRNRRGKWQACSWNGMEFSYTVYQRGGKFYLEARLPGGGKHRFSDMPETFETAQEAMDWAETKEAEEGPQDRPVVL